MSRIKFRYWNGKTMINNVGFHPFSHFYHNNEEGCITVWTKGNPNIMKFTGFTDKNGVMQFTGFTDNNGVEIYEGDILSDEVETDAGKIKSYKQVYWKDKTGMWFLDESYNQDKTTGSPLYSELENWEYEVSGNIYENKELLP